MLASYKHRHSVARQQANVMKAQLVTVQKHHMGDTQAPGCWVVMHAGRSKLKRPAATGNYRTLREQESQAIAVCSGLERSWGSGYVGKADLDLPWDR